ncbi:uncharacterized protein LOC143625938 [Bidens hawaiensis]|uniref:uncharacterized protein LOC143625938 n=1 Tax=Bidens hawaiensis TaxID=980011 RepID=UPI004049DA9C
MADPKPTSLHPAYTVTNIKQRIRTLDGEKLSYHSWVKPLGSMPQVLMCYNTSTTLWDELFDRVLVDQLTAYEAWKRVENLFLNNKGSQAAALQHELINLTLAAMPYHEAYCQRIRELADQLTDVDCPINNTQRIIYLVRGLPREYEVIGSTLNHSLSPWENAIDQLQSEARRIAAREQVSPTPVVAAAVASQLLNREPRRSNGPRRDNRNNKQNQRASK